MENTILQQSSKRKTSKTTTMNNEKISFNDDDDDDDEGDFGDFQTCNHDQQTSPLNHNDSINPTVKNIFELDWFRFKQFRSDFEVKLLDYFDINKSCSTLDTDEESNNANIRSHEDIINDCPIWYQLSGSFNMKAPLQFPKSLAFKRFYDSLKTDDMENSKSGDKNLELDLDVPVNTRRRNQAGDEEDIANDLDMHSLIIGSFQESSPPPLSNQNSSSHKANCDQLVDADQVIREIESLYSNQSTPIKSNRNKIIDGSSSSSTSSFYNKPDPLLSLNASSLLDAALKTWQMQNVHQQKLTIFHQNDEQFDDKESDSQFHSLPADLNNEDFYVPKQQTFGGDNLDDSVLALKASNLMLNSKLQQQQPQNSDQRKVKSGEEMVTLSKPLNKQQKELVEKLNQLSIVQLNELYMELEQIIQIRSEVLIQELALRDELEFEKEQKNTFISLLLSVQNKRRHYTSSSSERNRSHSARKSNHHRTIHRRNSNDSMLATRSNLNNLSGGGGGGGGGGRSGFMSLAMDLSSLGTSIRDTILHGSSSGQKSSPVYLTTVIPYTNSMIPIDLQTLQILIKLLKALNEDSPTVPALLTDYILKVICP